MSSEIPHYIKEIYRAYFRSRSLENYRMYFIAQGNPWLASTGHAGVSIGEFIRNLADGKYPWLEY